MLKTETSVEKIEPSMEVQSVPTLCTWGGGQPNITTIIIFITFILFLFLKMLSQVSETSLNFMKEEKEKKVEEEKEEEKKKEKKEEATYTYRNTNLLVHFSIYSITPSHSHIYVLPPTPCLSLQSPL